MKASSRDRLGSVLILVFIASLWLQRNYITPFGGIFPDIVMEILAGIAVVTLALSFTRHAAMKGEEKKKEEEGNLHWEGMIVVGGILLIWAVFLRFLGFIVAGLVGFTAVSWYLAERPRSLRGFVQCAAVAAAVTFLLVLVFQVLLQVPLPPGKIFD